MYLSPPRRGSTVGTTLRWIRIDGGTCSFGDSGRRVTVPALEWTQTVLTPAQLGRGGDQRPLTAISQCEAAALARELGGRLPRSVEWEWAAAGTTRRRYPWGQEHPCARLANLRGGLGQTVPVGSYPAGATPEGLLEMAGNVWEWTRSSVLGDGFVLRGGSFDSPPLYARTTFLNAAPAELQSPGIGVRVVRDP